MQTLTGEEMRLLLEAARLAEVGRLVASVIHDVSTPLASVALRAESLLHTLEEGGAQPPASTERFPRYLRSILDDAFRCKDGLARLSTLTRPPGPIEGVVNLNALCGDILALFQYDAMCRQVRTELVAPAPIAVSGRDARLPHALAAIVRNAIEASPPGGRVVVEARVAEAGFAALSVTDDGPGVPPEARDRLFDPFFTTKPPSRGRAGLGLTLCHDIVRALGGEISVESEPGRGTRLTLRLPLASGSAFPANAS